MNRPSTANYDRQIFYDRLGQRIETLRTEAGMSRAKLADECGVSTSAIYNAEKGQGCSTDLLAKIAYAIDCTLDDLCPVDMVA